MTGSNVVEELTREVLNIISRSQAAVADAIETLASAVQSAKPDLPRVSVPFADKLPTPRALVGSAYDVAEQLLASQRKFAEDLLTATAPLLATGAPASGAKGGKAAS